MSKFRIIRESPYEFKEQILEFWEEYLPGTPSKRLDWMANNPAGPAIWLFALEEKTGILAGTISILPKELIFDNSSTKACILGDLMIQKKHRVFGPALDLLKNAIAVLGQEEFEFIYTIPNLRSKKIIERVGFRPAMNLRTMMSPQKLENLISKYLGHFWARKLEIPLLTILKLISRETYVSYDCVFEEVDWQDESINTFHEKFLLNQPGFITGSYQLSYLKWRYKDNPELKFNVYTVRQRVSKDIQGYFVVSVYNQRLELYDIIGLDDKVLYTMIDKIKNISKINNCRGVYFMVSKTSPLLSLIKKCNFFDTGDHAEVYFYPNRPREVEHWYFCSADRNI